VEVGRCLILKVVPSVVQGTVHEVDVVDGLLSSYLVLRFSETRVMRSSDDEPAWEAAYWSAMPGQLTPVAGDEDGGMTIVEALTPGDEAADGEEDVSEPKAKKGSQKKQQKKKKKSGGGKGKGDGFTTLCLLCPAGSSVLRPVTGLSREVFCLQALV
jgi:hypothetical protein